MAEIRIGTSGFAYKEWKPAFYPSDLPQRRFLEHYASELPAVEIDSTFYRMPKTSTLEAWRAAVPPAFRFSLKASRRVTHWERLRLPSDALDYTLSALPALGDRLGVVLFQLPPNFRLDLDRLTLFLDHTADAVPCAFEFRHESWFTEEVYAVLRHYRTPLVIHDSDDGTTPAELTGERTYVRLRRSAYSGDLRTQWIDRFRDWKRAGVDVYGFVKHADNPDAPLIAREWMRAAG